MKSRFLSRRISYTSLKWILNEDEVPTFRSNTAALRYVKEWVCRRYDIPASEINNGYCFIFAYIAWLLVPEPLGLQSNKRHIWLVDTDGVKYDSDHLTGAKDIGWGKGSRVNKDTALMYWAHCGKQRVNLRKLIEKVEFDNPISVIESKFRPTDMPSFKAARELVQNTNAQLLVA